MYRSFALVPLSIKKVIPILMGMTFQFRQFRPYSYLYITDLTASKVLFTFGRIASIKVGA